MSGKHAFSHQPVASKWLWAGLFLSGVAYHSALTFRNSRSFLSRPFIEDSFYVFSVARSLAQGRGISVDGVHPTNGLQPLIAFLEAPLFALSTTVGIDPLRLVLLLHVLIYAGVAILFGILLSHILRNARLGEEPAWMGACLVIWNYSLSVHMLNGLETGLATLLAFLATYLWHRNRKGSRSQLVVLGCVLGLCVLSRIDLGVLLLFILVLTLADAKKPLPRRIRDVVLIGVPAALISFMWFAYDLQLTGHFLPTSGRAIQLANQTVRSAMMATGNAILSSFLLFFHLPMKIQGKVALTSLLVSLWPVVLVLVSLARPQLRNSFMTAFTKHFNGATILPLLLLIPVHIVMYTFLHRATHFQPRYLLTIRWVVLWASLAVLWGTISVRERRVQRLMLTVFCVPWIASSFYLGLRNWSNESGNSMLPVGDWLAGNTSSADRIGMFQSGTTGYMFPERVTNLDGKVNIVIPDVYRAGGLAKYIASESYDYVIDWHQYISLVESDSAFSAHYRHSGDIAGEFQVWRRRDNEFTDGLLRGSGVSSVASINPVAASWVKPPYEP